MTYAVLDLAAALTEENRPETNQILDHYVAGGQGALLSLAMGATVQVAHFARCECATYNLLVDVLHYEPEAIFLARRQVFDEVPTEQVVSFLRYTQQQEGGPL